MGTPRVLLALGSEVPRAIHARALEAAGFAVDEAGDFEQAVLALGRGPDLVVVALALPSMEGFPLLRLLKSDAELARIPLLVLAGEGEAASRFWGEKGGADACLDLDAAPEELAARAHRLLAARAPRPAGGVAGGRTTPVALLARVAERLEASLLTATVTAEMFTAGLGAEDFASAASAVLARLEAIVDAQLLAVAIGDRERARAHVALGEPLAPAEVDELFVRLAAGLELPPGAPVERSVSGERGSARVDFDRVAWVPLPVRSGRASLALLPRDPEQFATATASVVDGLVRPLGLLLESALLSERLRELSVLDSLTRLFNRRAIFERLSQEIERARRYRQPLAVVLCDFDHFKRINDQCGHLAGDAVLREGAARLRRALRSSDLIGRYGGEEFLAVLPQVDLDAGRLAAERLRTALAERPLAIPGLGAADEIRVTASFGVASLAEFDGSAGADELVGVADRRLYEAKAAGRDRVRP